MVVMIFIVWPVFTACAGPDGSEEKDPEGETGEVGELEITDVRYMILNMDESFIAGTANNFEAIPGVASGIEGVTSCFWFQVNFKGEMPDVETLSVKLRFGDLYEWNVTEFEDEDVQSNSISIGQIHPWDGRSLYQAGVNVLPLGDLTVEVYSGATLLGKPFTKTIAAPGENGETAYNFIYSEDARQQDPSHAKMIPKAEITRAAEMGLGRVTVYFDVNDDNARFSEVWFFDQQNQIVAASNRLENSDPNVFTIDDFNYFENTDTGMNYTFADIARYAVVTMDSTDYDENFDFESGGWDFTIFTSGSLSVSELNQFSRGVD